jgi:hypothetical protein
VSLSHPRILSCAKAESVYMQRHQTNGLECNEVLSETASKSGMRQKFYILELREMQRTILSIFASRLRMIGPANVSSLALVT